MQNSSWNDIMGGIKLREENLIFKPKLCQMMLVYYLVKLQRIEIQYLVLFEFWIGCNQIDKSCQIKNIKSTNKFIVRLLFCFVT